MPRGGIISWVVFAIIIIWLVKAPESAAGLITTLFGWIAMAADSLGTFVKAVS